MVSVLDVQMQNRHHHQKDKPARSVHMLRINKRHPSNCGM